MAKNPKAFIEDKILLSLKEILKKLNIKGKVLVKETSKKSSFGDLCTPVFQLGKANKRNPNELAKEIADNFPENELIKNVSSEGGFVNYSLNRAQCSKLFLDFILSNKKFFYNNIYKNMKIIVEHTSANPNGPIHIGNFRGSIIGDTYARILKVVGADVITHFYVDDLGHQVPVAVIGYELLKKYNKVSTKIKKDHFIGQIYGITHTMYDIQKLKQELEKYDVSLGKDQFWLNEEDEKTLVSKIAKAKIPEEEYKEFKKQFKFLVDVQNNVYKRFKNQYESLKKCLEKEQIDLPVAVLDLNRRYMEQEKEAVKIVRATCGDVLNGQREELSLLGITHDQYDWESDLQWAGKVSTALSKLNENGFIIEDNKARIFDANKAADLKGARDYLKLKKSYEVPNALLITSAGDTLYLLRDIAYSLDKIDVFKADKVFNVIGKPQELTQKQLNLALRAVGRSDVADKTWHLNYEYIELRGALIRMSARRLQYITPLELFELTKQAVLDSFLKDRDYPLKEKEEIAKIVAVGAIKYSIIAVGLMKQLIFDPQEVVSLTNNTSPFIQYAYARSQNILVKTDFKWKKENSNSLMTLQEEEEWLLILALTNLSGIVHTAAEQIKPELICNYLFDIATLFNKFYDNHRVLDASSKELITARLALTYVTGLVLKSGLELLGIKSPNRM